MAERYKGRRVWLAWVAYVTAGSAVAAALAATTAGGAGVSRPVAALGGLAAIASAQWLALHRYRPAIPWWQWVAATIIGHVGAAIASIGMLIIPGLLALLRAIASPFGTGTVSIVTSIAIGAVGGAVAGLATVMVLRRHFDGSGIWIVATAVAGAAKTLPVFTSGPRGASALPPFPANVLAGFASACIVGIAVAHLVRRVKWQETRSTRDTSVPVPGATTNA